MLSLYVLIRSIYSMYLHGYTLSLLGHFLTALPIVLLFTGLFIFKRARTKKGLPLYTLFISLGLVISLAATFASSNDFKITQLIFPISLVTGWVAYLKWYSYFRKRNDEPLQKGKTLPVIELEDIHKKNVSSQSFLGKPAVLLFYRGNWCPLCMAQIKEIAKQYKEIEALGAQVYMISPQPHSYSASLSKKYNLNFQFLTDVNNKVAKQLDIFSENGIPAGFQVLGYESDTVLPTVIITDKNGTIVFADLTDNYRVRPEPETFLEVLRTLV